MLKIGVLGFGHLGKIHVKCIQMIDQYDLVGIYDVNPLVAKKAAETYDLPIFDSVEALIAAVDVVDIVTPTITHFELAKKVIAAGKHFFIEKPITHTLEEAQTLCALIQNQPIKAQVGHVERFNPALLAIEDKNIQPMFVEAHRLAMFNPRGTDVSVVLDLMIHDLDIILKLIPHPVRSVQASGVAIVSPSADIANARIEFDNGAIVNITASRISMKNMRKLRVFQSDAYLSLDFLNKKTEVVRIHEAIPAGKDNCMELDTSIGKRYIELDMPEARPNNAIKMELESFAQSILDNRPTKVALEDGLKALQLAYWIMDEIQKHQKRVAN
ncbi:Gfo/Idh/MocA family oxidoreductase [Aureispira anguillae]|uniref:Gfo/Idh/MocA family oxidoreductase n=1 Tax=Aureispira anguillae TaxID=2864201 RepID=A0A915YG19_9BACT|nr:Gfo/Idh/MocA family oxidoreductase [Aureispira anguillae]BDS12443.1 Gfo/Idh/MocA family oxidoreductase [Aureispira anguillae]